MKVKATVDSAVAAFGAKARAKLANPGASGEPEEQLRAPFEQLLADFAGLASFPKTAVAAVGESSVSDLKTRPDYAVTVHKALVGFIELKAPGKGADPSSIAGPDGLFRSGGEKDGKRGAGRNPEAAQALDHRQPG